MATFEWPPSGGSGVAGVSSLNTLTGALTLAAGSGITITPSGGNTLTIAATGSSFPILAPDGSAGAPSYSWASDSDTGIFRGGSGIMDFVSNGGTVFAMNPTNITFDVPILNIDGSAGAPSYSFTNDTDTGITRGGSGILDFISNGSTVFATNPALVQSSALLGVSLGIDFTQIATPSNPSASHNKLYFKSDNNLYKLTSGGVETVFSTGGSGDINNGGNTFGSDITIGTTDNFNVSLITNGVAGLTVDNTAPAGNTTIFGILKLKDQAHTGFVSVQGDDSDGTDKSLVFQMVSSATLSMSANLGVGPVAASIQNSNNGDVTIGAFNDAPTASGLNLTGAFGQILHLEQFDATHPGGVPLSGGGTTNFLRADGTWAAPSGGSGVTTVGTFDSNGSSANGLSISTVNIFAQSATASNPGMVNADTSSTQNFAGAKFFKGSVAIGETDGFYNSAIANGYFAAITGLIAAPALTNGTERMGLFCVPKFGSSPSAHVSGQQLGVELSNNPANVNLLEILPMISTQFGVRTTGIVSPDLSATGATNCASLADDFTYTGQFFIHQTGSTHSFFGGRIDSNIGFVGPFLSGLAGAGLSLLTDFGGTTAVSMDVGGNVSIPTTLTVINTGVQNLVKFNRYVNAGDGTGQTGVRIGNSGSSEGDMQLFYTNAAATGAPASTWTHTPRNNADSSNTDCARALMTKSAASDGGEFTILTATTGGTLTNAIFVDNAQQVVLGTGTGGTHRLNTALGTNGAGILTLTNGPSGTSGNPTGYIQININGTNRFIPFW